MKRLLPVFAAIFAIVLYGLLDRGPTPERASTATSAPQPAPVDPVLPEVRPEVPEAAPRMAESAPVPDFGGDLWEAPKQPDFQKVVAFNEWAHRWVAADKETRRGMAGEGLRLAEARRPEFKALIVTDPRRALEQAVPRVILQDLPSEIVARLEKPISTKGDFRVYRGRPRPGTEAPAQGLTLRYFETPKGESFKARVYGAMAEATSRKDVPLRGVAVDREFAVAESPVRQLEVGERIPANATVDADCPVSGETTPVPPPEEPVTEATPTVEVGGRMILLCNGTHVQVVDEKYRSAMGQIQASGPGGSGYFFDNYPGTSSEAIGNFRCLYIRITYPDQMRAPNTEDSAYSDMRNVSRYYLESSFGKLTTTSTVTPLIVLPHTQSWYIAKDSEQDGLGLVHSDARAAARKLGYDSNQFNCTIVRVNGGPRLSGISWGGGDSVWVSWDGMDVLNHECGHSLGRNHANFWQTTDGTAYGIGANQEYGNSFDVMGGGGGFGAHYNTISKRALGWLPDLYLHRPTANGVFRVFAYDQPQLEEGRRYGLRVQKDSVRSYYLEYHPAMGGQLPNSALVLYSGMGSNAGHLLDTTPGSTGGKGDGGIQIGRTYSDPEADLHFTVLAKNNTTPPSLDIAYMRGPFPGNQSPTVTVGANTTSISAGGSITFTAIANDPDGDQLAYHWDFNDGVATTNTPTFTRTFPSTDQMTVMVTVSDMKGGIARDSILVNVGNHGRHTITGTITTNGIPLAGVRVTSDNSKYALTDTDGTYVLSDLQTGSRTLTATLNGYTFTPGFTNPITVVAGANVANWTAVASTTVTLTKTGDATEGGANGTFVLTRTGDTSADLAVRVAPASGTATLTTDYTFSPAYVDDGNFRTFTIPAGQSSLTVQVQPVNDTAQEGPETVVLQLAGDDGYLAAHPSVATMTLNDNDTSLPKVSVEATDLYTAENTSETGRFTFRRTGSTTNPLNLTVSYSGSATNGADYASLPTTVVLSAGQATATLDVSALNDAAMEGPEDCTVTIASNAAYVRDSSAQSATVSITDDDLPVVNVSVADADAAEAGRDVGVFHLTRTGSTTSALKVYYGLSGSALHGTDYQALPGEITFPAGATTVPVIITPYDDEIGEPETQTVTLQVTTFNSAYTLGTNFSANLNITDNDDVPVVSVRAGSTVGSEPGTNPSFSFRSTGSATGNITVQYTVSGTATAGADYTALSGSVVISANGSNEVTVNVPVLNDAIAEDTETVEVTITPHASYRIYNDGSAIARIRDDENAERVTISPGRDPNRTQYPVEGGAAGRFYVARAGSTGALAVNYTVGGTATNGTDYTALSGVVVIPDGATGADITITPTNDTLAEGTETITLAIAPGEGYGADTPSIATLYLNDNETPAVTVAFDSATGSTTEAPGALGEYRDIPVSLSAASAETVTVEYTSNGGTASGDDIDWTYVDASAGNAIIPGGVLTFPPGTLTQTVRIRVRNDGLIEGNETAILDLRNARGARVSTTRNRHTLTISDANDPVRRVRFLVDATTRTEGQGSDPMLMAVLDRAPATGGSVTVNYSVGGTATAGSDYTLPPGSLTFSAGESVKLLPLTILTDAQTEAPETIVVTLHSPVNAELGTPTTHTVTLRESTIPTVSVAANSAEFTENAGNVTFTVTRTAIGTSLPLTVNYSFGGTAAAGEDFTAPTGTIIIPAGQESVTLSIPLLDDMTEEADETLIITITGSAGYELGSGSESTALILDNDAPPVVSVTIPTKSDVTIPAGVGMLLRAEGLRTTPDGTTSQPVVWSTVSGPGIAAFETEDSNYTAATFPVPGQYVLRATATYGTAEGTEDVRVNVGGTLTAQVVGSSSAAGSWSETETNGGSITVSGAGTGLSSTGTSDGFYFLAAPRAGDFDLRCRVVSIANPGGNSGSCRVGIMARATTAANAPYAMSIERATGAHSFHARLTAGAATVASQGGTNYTFPVWIRLVRIGDEFSAYYSQDGTSWSLRGSPQTIPAMGASPLVGFAVTSAVTGTASTAVFDSMNFALPTNIGPLVDAGPALSGSGPWTLAGNATDDGRPTPSTLTKLWRALSGPGSAQFASASEAATAVTFTSSGAYRLRLTANDGAITTFDETMANITSMTPLEAWRFAEFGTTSNAGNAADDADPDFDGLWNLMEYALGTPPKSSSVVPMNAQRSGGEYILTYPRHPARSDVALILEASPNPSGTWTPLAQSQNGGVTTSLASDTEVTESGSNPIQVTATITLPSPVGQRYFRLRAEKLTP